MSATSLSGVGRRGHAKIIKIKATATFKDVYTNNIEQQQHSRHYQQQQHNRSTTLKNDLVLCRFCCLIFRKNCFPKFKIFFWLSKNIVCSCCWMNLQPVVDVINKWRDKSSFSQNKKYRSVCKSGSICIFQAYLIIP